MAGEHLRTRPRIQALLPPLLTESRAGEQALAGTMPVSGITATAQLQSLNTLDTGILEKCGQRLRIESRTEESPLPG